MKPSTAPHPNILWISLEDTSPRFGCYGDPVARTPHIDRLAAAGCRWPNTFSTAAVCAPARCAIITGCYAISVGGHHMRTLGTGKDHRPRGYDVVLPHYVKLFPEYLRAAGYYCTNNHKTDYQFHPPVSAWDECHPEAHWRHRPDPAQPFFAVFNPTMTHESGMWEERRPIVTTDPTRVTLPPYLPDTPKARQALARYYDNIAEADDVVGSILAQLEEDGLAGNTIVFLWSDHGEGLPRAKRWPYDAGLRVPMIVRWPGQLDPGSVSADLVSTVDLAPTVLGLAGIDLPLHLQGQPFLGSLAEKREYVYASRDRHDEAYDMVRAVRDRQYKYLRHFRPELPYLVHNPYQNRHPVMQEIWRLRAADQLTEVQQTLFRPRPVEELYDLDADPYELTNLASATKHRATLDRLRQALDDWRDTVGDLGEQSEDQMFQRMWPGGVQPVTLAPLMIPLGDGQSGRETTEAEADYRGPLLVQLHCSTQGASIVYTLDTGDDPRWQLYTSPLRLPAGRTMLRAKAIRVGYRESDETQATFNVTSA